MLQTCSDLSSSWSPSGLEEAKRLQFRADGRSPVRMGMCYIEVWSLPRVLLGGQGLLTADIMYFQWLLTGPTIQGCLSDPLARFVVRLLAHSIRPLQCKVAVIEDSRSDLTAMSPGKCRRQAGPLGPCFLHAADGAWGLWKRWHPSNAKRAPGSSTSPMCQKSSPKLPPASTTRPKAPRKAWANH